MRFDFPTLIVVLVFATGIIWAFDAAVLARRRRAVARQAEGASEDAVAVPPSRIVEYSKSFFPVFLIVLVLRSFIVEPFRIPSNSMMPTLLTGDFILVNKFDYGIRLPVVDTKIVDIGLPERGDVVVFRFPDDPATPFIKRVVGVPGDRIGYYDKVLYVNDEPMDQSPLGRYVGSGSGTVMSGASLRVERLSGVDHRILVQPGARSVQGEAVVPEGHYFVLGDNRDNSRDSRYWGTVSEDLLIGKAFRIWMNWDFGHGIDWKRIGKSID
ncbi:MAG: signal peptidase I [Chromatiales bacterium]|nr:signal peptidase I [Chromatiales bacterium]